MSQGISSAASAYLGRGWVPIPLRPRQKVPLPQGWPALRPSAGDVAGLFGHGENVGIHLGPSGLVDIDLDCPEAVRLAPRFLPPTPLRFGRASSPGSHWLYASPDAPYLKLQVGRETLVELRAGEGKQTVLPPSVHPSGEQVRWETGSQLTEPPAEILPHVLVSAVRRLAAAVLFSRQGMSDDEAVRAAASQQPPEGLVPELARQWCGWPAPKPKGRTPAPDADAKMELKDAAVAYVRDHSQSYPTRNGTCPVCDGKKCFKAARVAHGEPPRWSCWSSSHAATGVGVEGQDHWSGDVLDLDAHAAGMSVPEFLRDRGYLREPLRRLPPARQHEPTPEPSPTPDVTEAFEAFEAALDAVAEAAASDNRAGRTAAWADFLAGPFGLEGLAEAALVDHGRALAGLERLAATTGMATSGRTAMSEFKRLAKSARIASRRKAAGLSVVGGGPDGADQEPEGTSAPLERGDEAEVARRMLKDYLGENTVYDRSCFHRFDDASGAWLEYDEKVLIRVAERYAGHPVDAGVSEDGMPRPPKPLRMSHSFAAGAAKLVSATRFRPSFFAHRAIGCGFRNGFLHADGRFVPSSPGLRLLEADVLPLSYEPITHPSQIRDRCPLWTTFLDELFDGDDDAEAKATCLMQYVGATMLGVAPRYQRALLLYGPQAANGKSTLMQVLSSLFAPAARCAVPPHLMGEKFENIALASARANLVSDMPDDAIRDTGSLKAIVSGDEVQFRPLHKPPFVARPTAGHVFALNTLPSVRDRSRGFWRRMLVLTFNRSFEDDPTRDPSKARKVLAEREAIAAACLWHALGLGADGYLIPPSSTEVTSQWEHTANNVVAFLQECERVELPSEGTKTTEFYALYSAFSNLNGTRPIGRNKFFEEYRRQGWARSKSHGDRVVLARVTPGSELDDLRRQLEDEAIERARRQQRAW